MRRLRAALEAETSGLSLILTMAYHSVIDSRPACRAEGLVLFGRQFLIEATQESQVIDAHCLQISQLDLGAVSTQLRGPFISTTLEVFLGDIKCLKLL